MKKGLFIGAAIGLLSQSIAVAVPIYTDRSAWQSAVGVYFDVDLESAPNDLAAVGTLTSGTPILLPPTFATGLSFDRNLEVQRGSGWNNYINPGGGDPLVLTTGELSLTGTFSRSVAKFGFELFPAQLANMALFGPSPLPTLDITLTLSDGTHIFQQVDGEGEPQFFGWIATEGIAIDSFTITSDQVGFSIGNFVVPDGGATFGLLGIGLVILAAARSRFA